MEGMEKNELGVPRFLEESNWEDMREKSEPYIKLMSYYRCAMMEIETKFNVLNEEFSLLHDRNPISSIKCRLKSPGSILNKIKKNNLPYNLAAVEECVRDVAGVRVCCAFIDDVYMLADALLNQDDITLIEKKDYIANPKQNGYRSLHLIVEIPIFLANEKRIMKVEIQLRTIAMDFWASLEHKIYYKFEGQAPAYISHELKECADMVSALDEKMLSLNEAVQEYIIEQNEDEEVSQ